MRIEIKDFQNGIAPSPAFGFQEINGLEITDEPGFCYPGKLVRRDDNLNYSTAVSQIIVHPVSNTPVPWVHNGAGKAVAFRAAYNDWTAKTDHADSAIDNMILYNGYIGLINASYGIGWYNAATGAFVTTWASAVTGESGSNFVKALDGALYIPRGRYLDKIEENTDETFNPNSATTYTVTTKVLRVPETILDVFNIGDYLYIMTREKIYPWDVAAEAVSVETPIDLGKRPRQGIVYKNRLYVQAGYNGEWYVLMGGQVEYIGKPPVSLINSGLAEVLIGKPCISNNNLIMFGLGVDGTVTPQGIYSLNPETGKFHIEHLISSGGFGTSHKITFGPVVNLNTVTGELLWSWTENSVHRIDSLHPTSKKTGDTSFLISGFYNIGTEKKKYTFGSPKLNLVRPLVTNDSIKISYRTSLSAGWTAHETINTVGAQNVTLKALPAAANMQIKAVLNNTAKLSSIILE